MKEELLLLKLKGYCCSQIIMEMGLKRLNKENPDMITALEGLCGGVRIGKICGILSAAVCLFFLASPDNADDLSEEFTKWFSKSFGHVDCDDLLGGNEQNKVDKCPLMVEASFEKITDQMGWD
jgi:hypothetical protein